MKTPLMLIYVARNHIIGVIEKETGLELTGKWYWSGRQKGNLALHTAHYLKGLE